MSSKLTPQTFRRKSQQPMQAHLVSLSPSIISRLFLLATIGALGCSVQNEASSRDLRSNGEAHALPRKVESALTSACRLQTVGLPCDPDGQGSATECEGLCWVDDSAQVSCVPVAAANLIETDLNGRICGDEQGRDCSRSCENGECVAKNARLGTACRPGPNTTTCDGVCTLLGGEPVCDEVDVCDDVEISDDGCSLTACNFESFEQGCTTTELTNPVCEASKAEPDAASPSPSDASASDAGDAGSVVVTDGGSSSDAGRNTSGSAQTSSVADAAANASSNTSQVMSTGAPDGGTRVDAGTSKREPARVVGGACNFAGHVDSNVAAVGLLALASLVLRRKRELSRSIPQTTQR